MKFDSKLKFIIVWNFDISWLLNFRMNKYNFFNSITLILLGVKRIL